MRTSFAYKSTTGQGYLALPRTKTGRGVLVCHAWWGLNPFFSGLCDRLAAEGFVTFAPDLYGGKIAHTIDEAKVLRQGLDRASVNAQLKAAVQYLAAHEAVVGETIGVLGCSLGAHFAYWVSDNCPKEAAAVVAFYGIGSGNFSRTQAAYLGHYAETDDWGADPKKAVTLKAKLEQQGRAVTFYTYPGTQHWFFEDDVANAYQPEAANLAWKRSIAFLKAHLPAP